MVGKLDSISGVVKPASGLQLPGPTGFLTIVVWCRPILSSDSYYYSKEQLVETGLYRFGMGSECAVADGTVGTPLPSSTLQRAANAPIIFVSFFATKISASLAGHSRIPAAVCAKWWVRRRVTTALRLVVTRLTLRSSHLCGMLVDGIAVGLSGVVACVGGPNLVHAAGQQPLCRVERTEWANSIYWALSTLNGLFSKIMQHQRFR